MGEKQKKSSKRLPKKNSGKSKKPKPNTPKSPLDQKVPPVRGFKFVNGKVARNIFELRDNIESLSEISLKVHISKHNHEIAEWVGANFPLEKLTKKLKHAKSKKAMLKVLNKYIEKELPPESLPELKRFNAPLPSAPLPKKSTIPPKPAKAGKLENILPSLDDDLLPPEPTKDMLVKNSFFGIPKKTKQEHQDIDLLITKQREQERQEKKKKIIFNKEKELTEKEMDLAEYEKAQVREDEKLYSLKKIHDHDIRERLDHVKTKDKETRELKKQLEEQIKHYEEKDAIMDKLRQRYLDFIAKEANIEEREKNLNDKQTKVNNSLSKLNNLSSSLNDRFTELKNLNTQIQTDWKSKFTNFENLNHLNELKEKELLPKISKFQEDLLLFTNKEKIITKKYAEVRDGEKKLKLLEKKKKETITAIENLKETKNAIKSKSAELKKKEKELNNLLAKVKRNAELKENTKLLENKEHAATEKITLSLKKLLELPDLEKKNKEIKDKLNELDKKETQIKSLLEKIKTNKELKEDTDLLKQKLENMKKKISKTSITLLNMPEIEKKNHELKERSELLDEKTKQVLSNLDKIKTARELKENTEVLKKELAKVEQRIKEKTKELFLLEDKNKLLKEENERIESRKFKVERMERKVDEEKKAISDKKRVYEKQMEDLLDNKFHSYLETTIKKTTIPKDHDYKHNQIYILIDNCKDLIDLGKSVEAKKLYNKIRSLFIELNLKGTEHQILKETIKDLYNQIKIASFR